VAGRPSLGVHPALDSVCRLSRRRRVIALAKWIAGIRRLHRRRGDHQRRSKRASALPRRRSLALRQFLSAMTRSFGTPSRRGRQAPASRQPDRAPASSTREQRRDFCASPAAARVPPSPRCRVRRAPRGQRRREPLHKYQPGSGRRNVSPAFGDLRVRRTSPFSPMRPCSFAGAGGLRRS
jgi:hypothetical protein